MRNYASGTHAHTPNSPRFTPGPWRCLGHCIIVAVPDLFAALAAIVAECNLVAEDMGKDLIPNRLLDQARTALKLAQEGRQ